MADSGTSADDQGQMPRIVQTEGVLGGDPRIEGTRIGVLHVYQRYVQAGDSAETIADSYDLSLAEVHAALAYAFSNPEEMESLERRNQGIAEATASTRLRPEDIE